MSDGKWIVFDVVLGVSGALMVVANWGGNQKWLVLGAAVVGAATKDIDWLWARIIARGYRGDA